MRGLDKEEAQRLRDAPKDAFGQQVAWQETRRPSGLIVRQQLSFAVEVDPPPGRGGLVVEGLWKSPEFIQIFLRVVDGAEQQEVARLCLCPKHDKDLHFHDEKGKRMARLSHLPSIIDGNSMLDDVFIPRMSIENVQRPMLP